MKKINAHFLSHKVSCKPSFEQIAPPLDSKSLVAYLECFYQNHVCIGKHDVGKRVCQHFGPIGFTATKFYLDSSQYSKASWEAIDGSKNSLLISKSLILRFIAMYYSVKILEKSCLMRLVLFSK